MTIVRTLKPGATVVERAIFSGDNTDVPTAAPTATERGYCMQGAARVHLYATFGGTVTSITVVPYYRSAVNDVWYAGTAATLDTTGDGPRAIVEDGAGEKDVFFAITAVTGAGSIVLHAGYSFAEPGRDG